MEQLELMTTVDAFECDGCDKRGQAAPGAIPPGWVTAARGIACTRGKGGRRGETFELHYCETCRAPGGPRISPKLRAEIDRAIKSRSGPPAPTYP
jgi:hypothetical protein